MPPVSSITRHRRRMPAEWEPCQSVLLAWPHNRDTWPGQFTPIPSAFARLACSIAEHIPLNLLAAESLQGEARDAIASVNSALLPSIRFLDIPTNDCWVRDYGPTFVWQTEGDDDPPKPLLVNFHFNAWGGKYHPHDFDTDAGRAIAQSLRISRLVADLTLEGGSLETDGRGRFLVHRDCILNPNRNPGLTQEDCAARLNQYLGAVEILWLDGGQIDGDDTDGHVDQIARFVDCENVVVAVGQDPRTSESKGLEQNYRQLKVWGQQSSPAVQVHRLPCPPRREINGQAVPQSYCNFLRIGPDVLLMPIFGNEASDQFAIELLSSLCGQTKVIPVDCHDIVWGLGAIHCATSQVFA